LQQLSQPCRKGAVDGRHLESIQGIGFEPLDFVGCPFFGRSRPVPTCIEEHSQARRTTGCREHIAREADDRQLLRIEMKAEFLLDFAQGCRLGRFSPLDLAPREFP